MAYNKQWKPVGKVEYGIGPIIRKWKPTYTVDKGWVMPWVQVCQITRIRMWHSTSYTPELTIRTRCFWVTKEGALGYKTENNKK